MSKSRVAVFSVVLTTLLVVIALLPSVTLSLDSTKAQSSSRYFPETAHSLKGGFLRYWQQNGDLAIFGYPLSEEIQEKSETDGKIYTVQYLERARFEYHPENKAPYDVLLGQLGRDAYVQRYQPNKPNMPTPTQVGLSPRLIAATVAGEVVAAGGQLFWIDSRNGGHSLYSYDPSTQKETLISDSANGALTSNGHVITWLVAPNSNRKVQVQRYDPASKRPQAIATLELRPVEVSPFGGFPLFAADASTIYYELYRDGVGWGLYALDLATGKEQQIADYEIDSTDKLVVNDGALLWSEISYDPLEHTKLHVRKAGGADTIIADAEGCPMGYALSGSKVVWSLGCITLDERVYLSDLQSGRSEPISSATPEDIATDSLIQGNLAVWIDAPEGAPNTTNQWSLVSYDLASQTKAVLVTSTKNLRAEAIIAQNAIAYLGIGDGGNWGLYLIETK